MHSPKPPAPDPAIAAAQAKEQARAEAGQISQTQRGLSADTIALRRRFGTMAAALGGPASFGTPGAATPGTTTGGSADIFTAANSNPMFSGMGGVSLFAQ